ncbi:methenyltetrahydromethanopterin cyclohydrolase [Pseudoflavonifractor sp. 524-17]|uniref:methenyltetrahydromethanopterin cyclohydrolase n=1 Tax=Pseudoflavonifractor sp. 524-17 TaxID=2304577 RepID=UPI001379E8FA|nr:methenyltetrahydromethanopterin cyclohydrolase [Pseudoflavonifractor sp. 524-17]
MEFSLNQRAAELIRREILPHQEQLQVKAHHLSNGATVIDMGVHEKAGWRAGQLFTHTCLGGLGRLDFTTMWIGPHLVPAATVTVDRPAVAELSSHDAIFVLDYRGARITFSGPFRALGPFDDYAAKVPYRDEWRELAVAHLQTDELPDEALTGLLADAIGISPQNLCLLAARTGTLSGAVQVTARNVEQTFPTLVDRGFDVNCVVQAAASSPIIHGGDDENMAYGRVNDCLIYGQETNLWVDCPDGDIQRILPDLTFDKNTDIYGTPFEELFARSGRSWANVPRDWDAPCKVNFHNLRTGRTFSSGRLGYEVLEKSFLGSY